MGQSSSKNGHLSEFAGHLSRRAVAALACAPDQADRVRAFLRRLYPARTVDMVACDTGLDAARVRKWLDRGSAPSAAAIVCLIAAYGPEFLAVLMGEAQPGWLADSRRRERARLLAAEQARLDIELAELADAVEPR